ncbi:MAG TPA: glycosyltransferase [Rhizomicrobium sp.]|nr:glycosyltransferase [Rhizomicrobium sp.]
MVLTAAPLSGTPLDVLVITPTPTHPAIQGNRQRVFEMCRAMESAGADVTLLYYATEAASAASAREMRTAWSRVEIVFPRNVVHGRSLVRYPAIDDWYDDEITAAALRLCAQKQFDVCLVNYVWYSKLFEYLPANMVRVIDTHDLFGARAVKFAEIGLDPAWFHTSIEQEKLGLDRADFVIAIQDSEAVELRQRTNSAVHSVGSLAPCDFLPARPRFAAERLSVGYVGSGNPFNAASMLAFAGLLRTRPHICDRVEFLVAGQVCNTLAGVPHRLRLLGVVDSISEFYRSIDVAINPMLGGTGLKMKSLEALAFGKPLVATADAMAGIPGDHAGHRLTNQTDLLEYLVGLADRPAGLQREMEVARQVYRAYRRSQLTAFNRLWSDIVIAARKFASLRDGADSNERIAGFGR